MDNLVGLISKANRNMNEFIIKELHRNGYNLHPSHGNIMINFVDENTLNYKELSKKINKSPQTMTTLIRKLEEEDLVVIHIDENDKRNKLVSLTKKGTVFIDVMLQISKDLYEIQYQGLTTEEKTILRTLLDKVITNFEGENHER